jgi:hypothetical protein
MSCPARCECRCRFSTKGELLALIDDIRKSVRAMIQLRSCNLERAPAGAGDRNNPAPLKAECTLEWITLEGTEMKARVHSC